MTQEVTLTGYHGINNKLGRDRIKGLPTRDDPLVDLSAARNVDLDDSGKPSLRPGYTLFQTLSGAHSGFAYGGVCLYVRNSILYRFHPADKTSFALLPVGSDQPMRYFAAAGRIFFTNSVVIGEVVNGVAAIYSLTSVPFKGQLPAGQTIAHHKARVYVGSDMVLWISDVKPLSRVDLRYGFKQFPDRITLIAPGPEGIYVGTEKALYYAPGGNPLKMPFTKVSDFGVFNIPPAYLDASLVSGVNSEGVYPIFATEDGICYGLPGQPLNLTSERFVLPQGSFGASFVRDVAGQIHLITSYR